MSQRMPSMTRSNVAEKGFGEETKEFCTKIDSECQAEEESFVDFPAPLPPRRVHCQTPAKSLPSC